MLFCVQQLTCCCCAGDRCGHGQAEPVAADQRAHLGMFSFCIMQHSRCSSVSDTFSKINSNTHCSCSYAVLWFERRFTRGLRVDAFVDVAGVQLFRHRTSAVCSLCVAVRCFVFVLFVCWCFHWCACWFFVRSVHNLDLFHSNGVSLSGVRALSRRVKASLFNFASSSSFVLRPVDWNRPAASQQAAVGRLKPQGAVVFVLLRVLLEFLISHNFSLAAISLTLGC